MTYFSIYLNYSNIILVLLLSISTILIYSFRLKISSYLKIIDYPNSGRKIHKKPVPLIGGPIIFINCIIILTYLFLNEGIFLKKIIIILILSTIFFFLGFVDDKKDLNAKNKTLILIFSLFIFIPIDKTFIISELSFVHLEQLVKLNQSSIFFTVFSIFALYNALNFADGINGIAISLVIYWIIFLFLNSFNFTYLLILLMLFYLLIFNLKNQLFLGNSGSSLLSLLISLSIIYEFNTNQNIKCDEILFLLFFPGIDMARVTIERFLNNKKIYASDNIHFHHYLFNYLKSDKFLFIIYTLLSISPLLLYYINKNFVINLFFFITIYFLILYKLKKNAKIKKK